MYMDKTGMFEDFNFKLVVIDSLLEKKPSFLEELNSRKEKCADTVQWYHGEAPISERMEYCSALVLEQEDLDKVTALCFDGGCEIYHILQPDWDGEEDCFDVTSVKGFDVLQNLRSVEYISMCEPEILEPMREKGIEIL